MQDTHPSRPPPPDAPAPPEGCAAFLARWRHALREPLNALLAAAQVLESAAPGSVAAGEARRIIARQARNLAWVVSELPAEPPGERPAGPPRR